MNNSVDSDELKEKVKEHWEKETCGTRYGEANERLKYFNNIVETRYRLEPYIKEFANFSDARGKKVLEIGVGAGSDFSHWCQFADHATGVDLTESAIGLTKEHLELKEVDPSRYSLQQADAENLPFPDNTFDIVYSWGVLHHTPQTDRAYREVFRVLKPGGQFRSMVYHTYSWTSLMVYVMQTLRSKKVPKSLSAAVFENLESPGTKVYSKQGGQELLEQAGFICQSVDTKLGPGDLLDIAPSEKYQSPAHKFIWKVYPRFLVRGLGDRYGLYLLLAGRKPEL